MIGQALPRVEDARLVTGRGRYTDDINLDGQVYAAFVRSPHAHATINGIEVQAAATAPGVLAVLTGRDYQDAGLHGINHLANPIDAVHYQQPTFTGSRTGSIHGRPHLPLAVDKVRHVGEAVAIVIAESAVLAREAAEQVMVDYGLCRISGVEPKRVALLTW